MSSPKKQVPLATCEDDSTRTSFTRRIFFCGVVVEGAENGRRLPDEIQDLVLSLGGPLESSSPSDLLNASNPYADSGDYAHKRAHADTAALACIINELVSTERSYVRRLQTLKKSYADPLRLFSRDKSSSLLPTYDAKVMFGNIDSLIPANEAFLADLERMLQPNGQRLVGGIGDVALRHFKENRDFEQYKLYYAQRDKAQDIFKREMSKKSSSFRDFIERIKYEPSDDSQNRVGLRELLMDPVQRIPRYTLLFRMMIKNLGPEDPQRAKLIEADEIASKIAVADPGEETRRALVLASLNAAIEGFPADLWKNSRRFIDCIDVEDLITELPSNSSSSSSLSGSILHCSLFLFDDKLLIVKRPGNGEKSGRILSGLDDLDKLTKNGGHPVGKKKTGMSFKGSVDITDVVAADVGGADIHLYLESPPPPLDPADKWGGRPSRALSVVRPPLPVNLDPTQTEADKARFLENLWNAQAEHRSKNGLSVVRRANEVHVDSKPGKQVVARTYSNIYQRTAFLQEQKKTKVVVHINPHGADRIPFGMGGPPYVIIQVQPMAGDLSRYTVSSNDDADDEQDIVQTERVPSRIVQTIHQFGLFEFRSGKNSRPSTPTGKNKTAMFGLDALSRKFNGRPGSAMGDFFGGSINSHKRTKSTTSRSSVYTSTISTSDGSLMRFSHRSNSTAATTISSMDDETSFFAKSTSSRSRNVLRRGKSPSASESERNSPNRSRSSSRANSRTRSRSRSRERQIVLPEHEDDGDNFLRKFEGNNGSEWDLNMQLELARKNSQNQHGKSVLDVPYEKPLEATIYEEEPPLPVRPASRASGTASESTARQDDPDDRISLGIVRPTSAQGGRPMGPRCPSPRPPSSTSPPPLLRESSVATKEEAIPAPLSKLPTLTRHTNATNIPRSKRLPLFPTGNTDLTTNGMQRTERSSTSKTEPLSIKKKASRGAESESPLRKSMRQLAPSQQEKLPSPRAKPAAQATAYSTKIGKRRRTEDNDDLVDMFSNTKNDLEAAFRNIKRIKLELEEAKRSSSHSEDVPSRPSSPEKGLWAPQRTSPPKLSAAQERMNEMKEAIERRNGLFGSPRGVGTNAAQASRAVRPENTLQSWNVQLSDAEQNISRTLSAYSALQEHIRKMTSGFAQQNEEMEKTNMELGNSKRQCDLVKSLLADATQEKEIMYEAFNEELDGMYNDANLPEDEAWTAILKDLKRAKEARNNLNKENSQLKQKMAQMQQQQEEWTVLLRSQGLIP